MTQVASGGPQSVEKLGKLARNHQDGLPLFQTRRWDRLAAGLLSEEPSIETWKHLRPNVMTCLLNTPWNRHKRSIFHFLIELLSVAAHIPNL